MNKHKTISILILILILGTLLRLWNLEGVPPSLNQDEAVNGVDAYTLGLSLRDHHGNFLPPMLQSFNDWASPTLTFITVPFVKVFGLSVWTIRFVNALIGIALIPLVFWLTRFLTSSSKAGLLGAFVAAVSPFAISLSRWAIPPSIVPTFLILFLVSFFWATTLKGKMSYLGFGLSGVAATALVYSYPTMKVFVPLLVIFIFVVYCKRFWRQLLMFGLVFIPLISPIYYLTLMQPKVYNSRFDTVGLGSSSEGLVNGFVTRFGDYFSPLFLTGTSDKNAMHHVPNFGPIPELFTLLIYVGIVVCAFYCLDYNKLRWLKDFFVTKPDAQSDSSSTKHQVQQNLKFTSAKIDNTSTNHDLSLNDSKDNILHLLTQKFGLVRKPFLVLLAAFVLFPIAPSLTVDKMVLTRGVQGLTLALVFIPVGYWYLTKQIANRNFHKYLVYSLLVVSLFTTFQFSYFYFGEYSQSQKSNFQYGIKEMFTYLKTNEAKFDKVEIVDINQPYIYKLFFEPQAPGTYDPKKMSSNIGKYYFGGVNKAGLKENTIIYTVKDNKDTWFKIYEYQPRWYIVTR